MPHQCTTCGHVFADGSKEMLSGCPDCGGTKFQFHPDGADIPDKPPGDAQPPERPDAGESVAGTVGKAAETVRNLVGSGAAPEDGLGTESSTADTPTETDPSPATTDPSPATADSGVAGVTLNEREASTAEREASTAEDAAQASARSDVVSPEELSQSEAGDPPSDGRIADTPEEDSPDLSELREELNDQFESIKVLEPGQYELNLMELYDREEYIIALQEDGKYSIQVPDRWQE